VFNYIANGIITEVHDNCANSARFQNQPEMMENTEKHQGFIASASDNAIVENTV